MNDALLSLEKVAVGFGGLRAVSDLDLRLEANELTGLIGPNGAGKTTVFNLISGVYRPTTGTIRLGGARIDGLPPHRIARQGVARTFQNIRLFGSLSVYDNVRVSLTPRLRHGIAHALVRGEAFLQEEEDVAARVMELLDMFGLAGRAREDATSLPYGDQRRLEIVRALATQPRLLLLDEPAAGMNASEKASLMDLIRFVQRKFRIAVLLVEHDMGMVMGICKRVVVLDHGMKIAEGSPDAIKRDSRVIEAYLGKEIRHA